MIIGIDATNLRRGGGVTHLIELLAAAEPEQQGIARIVIWGGSQTLAAIADRPWLEKRQPAELNRGLLRRTLWQRRQLSKEAASAGCDLLFVPGGSYAGRFRPVVTMSRNLLPFELEELLRYGWSVTTLKLLLLRWAQSRSFRRADGVIFLTQAAKSSVLRVTGQLETECPIIPHGLNPRFRLVPRSQRPIDAYHAERPYRVIYVSIIDQYKHQWHVVEAVSALRREGLPLALDLVGPAYPPALVGLNADIARCDPAGQWVHYHGAVAYSELHDLYAQADLGLFASSCENMPNTLLETMAAGLPVACSDRGPMPEVLGDAGVYFDPERPDDIARALREFIASPALRTEKAEVSYTAALAFDWKRCADDTFSFLARVATDYRKRVARCAG
ncbi:glycosyltransferase family 4 protein [Candidatus Thiosymbion oneisti]|uniref:glycosyltransferase family 4 protein n=1 Tax=Candidatus Thiosymbion oneisti TaxID=589554 RepID=UPI000A5A111F|nr:glycosyltransferase family 1 protein [Candidatus Thiosymbion oneisti]